MIILIDGYNLLRQIFPHIKGQLVEQRRSFIRQLGYYKHKKSTQLKELILVFDAGPLLHATREVKNGVVVMYSGQNSTADDWIIEYIEKYKNEDLLVVSNDRKITSFAQKHNAGTMGCTDFYKIMQEVLIHQVLLQQDQDVAQTLPKIALHNIKKFDESPYFEEDINKKFDQQEIDMLMEQASFGNIKKETENAHGKKGKKSPALSKEEKKIYSKLKKLY